MKDELRYLKLVNHDSEDCEKLERQVCIAVFGSAVLFFGLASYLVWAIPKTNNKSTGATYTTETIKEEYENTEEKDNSYILKYKKSSN